MSSKIKEKNLLVPVLSYPNKNNKYLGGIFVKDQIEALRKHFNHVYVVAPVLSTLGVRKKEKLCQDYEYENVTVFYPRAFFLPVEKTKSLTIDSRINSVRRLVKRKKLEIDLTYAHFTWAPGYIGYVLKKEQGIPYVLTLHENHGWLVKMIRQKDKRYVTAWKNADYLVRVNKYDVEDLKRYNPNAVYLPTGFYPKFEPVKKEEARARLNLPEEDYIIFSFGNHIIRKGFHYLIMAFSLLLKRQESSKRIRLVIGGKGPLTSKLKQLSVRLGVADNTVFTGFLSEKELELYLNASDLFVFPSLSESFGIALLEAMSVGKPVVATVNGGSETILSSEELGLLVPPKDPFRLSEAILEAMNKEWDQDLIREYALRNYSMDKIAESLINLFSKVLA